MVEKTLGPEKMAEIDQPTLRRLCREWAEKYVDVQREGFKRLGVNADWEHPYLTFTPNYEAGNVEVFKKMYLDGSVYRGRKPIHWCKRCHTALAEAEIEYSDETSPSIFVRFKLDAMPGVFEAAGATGDAYVLIWTTTPWTLPANTAVSLAPDADYVMVAADGANMIFARELVEQVAEIAGWESYDLVRGEDGEPVALKGRELTGLTYTCPVRQDLKGTVIYGDHVTLDSGTGAVHTAPGHGQDDYLVALEFDVPLLMPVDDNGVLTDEAGPFAGLDVDEANPVIIEWLRERGTLVAEKKILHSYPHCWRCHEPVIFRATDQWFVSMDKNSLRERALDAIDDEVEWMPAWAEEPHREHGGRPPRLVHLAPALVGRAHPRVQVRQVRQHGGHRRDVRRGDRPVLPRGRRRVVHARAVRVPAARREVRDVRLIRARAREGHPRRVVGERRVAHLRAEAPRGRGPALPGRHVPGRLRPAPRLVPVVASHQHGRLRRAAVQVRHALRLHGGRAGAQDVEVARQRRGPGRGHGEVRRRRAAPVGGERGLLPGREHLRRTS